MRVLLRIRPLLLLSVLCLGALAPTTAAQRESEFMSEFQKAMEINAADEMQRLVKQNQQQCILAVMEICEAISNQSSDQLESEIDALAKAWRKAFDSRFVLKQYEYFSLMDPKYKTSRRELIDRYLKEYAKFDQAVQKKDASRFPAIGMEMQGLGSAFEEVGDLYMASMCYLYYAKCFDEESLEDDADLRRSCEGYGKSCETRKRIELEDNIYLGTKERFDFLEFEGYGDPTKGPEARKAARAASDASFAPRALEGKFELVADIEELKRPRYTTDGIFQAWPMIYLQAEGSQAKLPTMENSPAIVRLGANKAMVDVDGDGEGDIEIPMSGKIGPVEITLGRGDEQRQWAFLACIGAQDATVQGIRPFNLAPDKNQMQIFVAPAASIVGMVGETRIQIIDENMDGKYGGTPLGWGYLGCREGDYQWDVDSIVIGDSEHAIPFSKYIQVGEDWYSLEPNEYGTDVIIAKDEIDTGKIELDLKGVKADFMILRGKGNNEDIYVDIAPGGKKGTEVPVGSYDLFLGRISKGKRQSTMKAMVLPSKNTTSWSVAAGGEVTVELGAPFGFDFSFDQDDDTFEVDGRSVVVTGRGRETYQRMWNCVPQVEVNIRKAGGKKGTKEAKMRPAGTQDEVNFLNDMAWIWFPHGERTEKGKFKGDPIEVQLYEKKNKLFGKIESDWKD